MSKRTKPYDLDFRNRALELVDAGHSPPAVAKLLGCYRGTITRWIQRREQLGHLKPSKRGKCPRKLDHAGQNILRDLVSEKSDRTLAELRKLLVSKGYDVSIPTIFRAIGRLGLTLKKSPSRLPRSKE